MFREAEIDGARLGLEITRLLADRDRLVEMAEKSGNVARPEATETIVNGCMELLKGRFQEQGSKILAF